LHGLVETLAGESKTRDLHGNALLSQFFEGLVATAPEDTVASRQVFPSVLQEHVEQACAFMVNHFAEGIHAEDVSDDAGLERSYFSKIFSQHTGTTVQQYLANLRRQLGEHLLRLALPDMRFGAVAVLCALTACELRKISG
jgi:AraC-like DNA-binding protein